MPEQSTGRHGAAVIVTDQEGEGFIVQIKDEQYRVPELIGAISLIGGGIEPGEDPRRTIERELCEEVADGGAKEAVRAQLEEWEQFSLEGACRNIKYDYQLTVYVSRLSKDIFKFVAGKVTSPGGLTEGRGRLLSREDMRKLCAGKDYFAWGIEGVVAKYLKSDAQSAAAEGDKAA